ncbi:APG5-domain-containing protein [Rhizopus microsporus var. microsporus]|uniref:APG5-domain-containing protein n=2 Tax=Rhizopus microsporus TaxID=58291 RepID=A0A2G4T671_RHIZD|nr:APG5-domain-containing protein [Rhizopus microsporus ATCC 52813]ORE06362.1 APG5-domain-containing protein [Rhizopus microsporus var. microsporus]PHZ16523.1 APG5-domain-containing protein [Rhizopus microsporus ATCC 52813]
MSSLLDSEISQKVWNAKLPIKILFDIQEMEEYANDAKWNPIFLEASRCSYLPLLTNRVREILSGLDIKIPDSDYDNVWYEYNHEPLRWHYPIGLLYDLYGHLIPLPWSITIHFKNLPTNSILARPTTDTIQSMFMSMIKEADFLRNGNTKKVMNLSKRDHTQLWQSIASDNYNDFWSVNKQLVEYTPSNRHIPIRLYLSPDCPVIQELVSFHDETGKFYCMYRSYS